MNSTFAKSMKINFITKNNKRGKSKQLSKWMGLKLELEMVMNLELGDCGYYTSILYIQYTVFMRVGWLSEFVNWWICELSGNEITFSLFLALLGFCNADKTMCPSLSFSIHLSLFLCTLCIQNVETIINAHQFVLLLLSVLLHFLDIGELNGNQMILGPHVK